jgi:transmembrane sensor
MTASLSPTADLSPRVRRQAANWLVELQSGDMSEDTRARWRRWHDAHPDHERAWLYIEAFGSRLQQLSSPLAHATLAMPGSVDRRRAVKTLALLLFAGSGALLAEDVAPWREWTADRRTRVGEHAVVMLADGTRVDMNGSTAIDIVYTDRSRLVRLVHGEIMVSTAHGPQSVPARPFLVVTAHGSIRALGTRFSVRETGDTGGDAGTASGTRSHVAVFEGAVEVRPSNSAGSRILQTGERADFTADRIGPSTSAREDSTAWTHGMIIAQDMPMGEFLRELARYRPGSIRCDPAVAGLIVTGTYPLADTDKVLNMLQTTLPVTVTSLTRYWITVSAKKEDVGDAP